MKTKRLTAKDIEKASYDNPVVVECDDGHYKGIFKEIKIISPLIKRQASAIRSDGVLSSIYESYFTHYSSPNQPRRIKLCECWDSYGVRILYTENNEAINTINREFVKSMHNNLDRKTGVEIWLNLDTWELEK